MDEWLDARTRETDTPVITYTDSGKEEEGEKTKRKRGKKKSKTLAKIINNNS